MLFQRSTPTCREQITRVLMMEALESRVFLNAALLDPSTQPRFVNELTGKPPIMQPTTLGGTDYVVSISQFRQQLGLFDPTTQSPLRTSVWGYNGSYPGATFEAEQGTPINVRWINNLVDAQGNPLPHLLPVDTTLHWANPPGWPKSGVPVVTHL
ncbi:MAG: multicopper oxidase domain-containing protein, partial [Bacillota bacterium]